MSFIPNAFANSNVTQSASSALGSFNFMSFLPMVIIFILFWFLLIRPQQKKAKLHNQMIAELKAGDEVITNAGILGKIVTVEEQYLKLEIANNVIITIQKNTIAGKANK